MILLTGELYPSPQILDAALYGPTVRVVDEEIHIGLLARGQIVQATDPIAQVKNRLAQVRAGESGGEGGEEEGIFREG